MSESSNADEARTEAEQAAWDALFEATAPLESIGNYRETFGKGFRAHAEWQASRKVEVTTDMVERAASAAWNSLTDNEWVEATERTAMDYREAACAALSAALNPAPAREGTERG